MIKKLIAILLFYLVPAGAWGAEFLVIADTKNSGDKYEIGNPVSIRPDGYQWGTGRASGVFVVVKLPGMSVAAGRKYMESDVAVTGQGEAQEITVNKIAKYRFDVTQVLNASSAKTSIMVDKEDFETKWTDTTAERVER